jgi:hypothetical protein
MSSFEQSLGLPALRDDWEEPNPVRFSHDTPGDAPNAGDDSTPPAAE